MRRGKSKIAGWKHLRRLEFYQIFLAKPLLGLKNPGTMIIWGGFGFLVGVVAFAGLLVGMLIANVLGFPEMGICLGLMFAAMGNWGLWKLIYPKNPRVLWDPANGEYVTLKPRHSLFFIPARFWTWIFLFLAIPATIMGVLGEYANAQDMKLPGSLPFKSADALLSKEANGPHHGNSVESDAAAAQFSTALKGILDLAFTVGENQSRGAGEDCQTFCQDSPDTIVFLCRIADLNKFKSYKSREALIKMAWAMAKGNLEKLDPEKKKALVVGLRDYGPYDIVLQGRANEVVPPVPSQEQRVNRVFFPAFVSH
jgi:hypothetical protein